MVEYKIGNSTVRFHGDPPPREILEKLCREFVEGVLKDGYDFVPASKKLTKSNDSTDKKQI